MRAMAPMYSTPFQAHTMCLEVNVDFKENYPVLSVRRRSTGASSASTANDHAFSQNQSTTTISMNPNPPHPPNPDPTFPSIATIVSLRDSLSDTTLTPSERHTHGQEMINASRNLTEQAMKAMAEAWVAMDPVTRMNFKLGHEFDPRYPLKEPHPRTIAKANEKGIGEKMAVEIFKMWVRDLDMRNLGPSAHFRREVRIDCQGGVTEVRVREWESGLCVREEKRVCVVDEEGERWLGKGEHGADDELRWARGRNEGLRGSY